MVTVKGPRGELKKNFSHLSCEMQKMKQDSKKRNGTYLRLRMWFGGSRHSCAVNTLKSLVNNMIVGVTEVSIESDETNCGSQASFLAA